MVGNLEGCFRARDAAPSGPLDLTPPRKHVAVLAGLGFDALSLANNHCDGAGAAASRELLAAKGIAGLANREARIFERQDTRVAVLFYATPTDEATLREAMSDQNAARLEALAKEAQQVVAMVHWGVEYQRAPSDGQRRLAGWPWTTERPSSSARTRTCRGRWSSPGPELVAWSLGNFVFDSARRATLLKNTY